MNQQTIEHLPQPNIALIPIEQIHGEHFNIRVGDPHDPHNRAVDRLVRQWEPDNCDPIQVRPDGNGGYLVVDGMHRLAAMIHLGQTHAWCRITTTPSVKVAASLFVTKQKGTTPLKTSHVFLARVVQDDEVAVAIKDAAERYGIVIKDFNTTFVQGKPKAIGSIDTVLRIHKAYGIDVLDSTFRTLAKAFPANPLGFRSHMLEACALFIATYDSQFGEQSYRTAGVSARLAERLPTIDLVGVLTQARQMGATYHQSIPSVLARLFLNTYNANLRTNRLPDVLPASKTQTTKAA